MELTTLNELRVDKKYFFMLPLTTIQGLEDEDKLEIRKAYEDGEIDDVMLSLWIDNFKKQSFSVKCELASCLLTSDEDEYDNEVVALMLALGNIEALIFPKTLYFEVEEDGKCSRSKVVTIPSYDSQYRIMSEEDKLDNLIEYLESDFEELCNCEFTKKEFSSYIDFERKAKDFIYSGLEGEFFGSYDNRNISVDDNYLVYRLY